MSNLRLLCTDLDRTLLPNGEAFETPGVRAQLIDWLRQHKVSLAFVTGRDHGLVRQAIEEFTLPTPDFVIADVGSTLFHCAADDWLVDDDWHQIIGADWQYHAGAELLSALGRVPAIELQEASKQGRYKLSFYTPLNWQWQPFCEDAQQRLLRQGYRVQFVYSVDEAKQVGLLDLLPYNSGKLAAIAFLQKKLALRQSEVLFSGDSGNDLDVLSSDMPAVLVANATPEVKQKALKLATAAGNSSKLYIAQGKVGNGNYAAGILEGIQHYFDAGVR